MIRRCKRDDVYDHFIPQKRSCEFHFTLCEVEEISEMGLLATDLRHQLYVFPIPFDKIFYELATALSHGERASTCQKPLIKFNRLEPLWSLTHA